MSLSYPNGIKPKAASTKPKKDKKVSESLSRSAANRGMGFESAINKSNQYYLDHDMCVVTKRPTPINIVKVDYSKGATITQAYFERQSTTDYNGVYKGYYLDFEAKSSRSKTSFPLNNIPKQQIEHLERVIAHKGLAFFLINFYSLGETYLLDAAYIIDFYKEKPRMSIPLKEIREHGHLVEEGYALPYDYLSVLDEFFLK